MLKKQIFMIAGPNGAGKTTTAKFIMSQQKTIHEFINADEIARGLAPMHPESMALTASKLMIRRFKELLTTNHSFAFETTAAGTNYVKHLQTAQSKGYEVHLFFLWLSSPELAIERVASRVAQGGHNIPEDTIRRRYALGMKNLCNHYLPLCNVGIILDNSEAKKTCVIAKTNSKDGLIINQANLWNQIKGAAYD